MLLFVVCLFGLVVLRFGIWICLWLMSLIYFVLWLRIEDACFVICCMPLIVWVCFGLVLVLGLFDLFAFNILFVEFVLLCCDLTVYFALCVDLMFGFDVLFGFACWFRWFGDCFLLLDLVFMLRLVWRGWVFRFVFV